MSNIKIDLKQFKHVKSTDKATTLRHNDGHEITLAHSALSKPNQAALKALANIGKQDATVEQSKESKTDNLCEGGKVPQKMADGGVPDALAPVAAPPTAQQQVQELTTPDLNKVPKTLTPVQQMYNQLISTTPGVPGGPPVDPRAAFSIEGEPQNFQPEMYQTAEQMVAKQQQGHEEAEKAKAAQELQENEVRARAGLTAKPMNNLMSAVKPDQQALQQPMDANSAAPQPIAQRTEQNNSDLSKQMGQSSDPETLMHQGFEHQMAGLEGESKTKQQLAQNSQGIIDESIKNTDMANKAYQGHLDTLRSERENLIKDINQGHINPDKFWTGDPKTGEGGHSKIMAGLGMILAGFNPTSNPNAATNFLKFQMEKNLEAQKQNLDSKQNLYRFNLEQYRNERDAADATRLQMNELMQHKLQSLQNQAATPMAKYELDKQKGLLEQAYAPQAQVFAMRRALQSLSQQGGNPGAVGKTIDYLEAMGDPRAKEYRERYIPGMGLASAPVPQATREKLVAHQDLDRIMNQVLQFGKQHSGSLNPQMRAQGNALMNELQSKLRTAESQGVYKESEAEFMHKTLGSSPAEFFSNYTTTPKVKQIQQIKQQDYQNILKGIGIQPQAMPGQQQAPTGDQNAQAIAWAHANPKDPRAAKILQLVGK